MENARTSRLVWVGRADRRRGRLTAMVRGAGRSTPEPMVRPSGRPVLPDFLVIGAPKAGTTTLAADLGAHPGLWLPARKELGWFDVRWRREPLEAYSAELAAAPPEALVGEATPTYLHAPGAVERIASCVPDVRLVAVLRDPVARAWSHYWYERTARLAEDRPPEEAILGKPADYLEPGRYAAHIRRVHAHFDPAQLHVVLLDELVADPAGTYRDVCRHVGVAEVVPDDVGRARNQAYAVRSPWLRRQMLRFRLWRRLPRGLGFRLDEWNRVPLAVPPMPDELRAALRLWYAADTADLESLLGRRVPWSGAPGDGPA